MVVCKSHQMLSTVNAPLVASKLAVQRVGDLKQVHRVEAGEKPFVALIIRAAVEHLVIYDDVVVAEQDFPDQGEARL